MICGVVTTSISGCDVCTEYCVVCDTTRQAVHISQPEILVATTLHIILRCIFTDQFHNIVALARLSIRSLKMVQLDRNM